MSNQKENFETIDLDDTEQESLPTRALNALERLIKTVEPKQQKEVLKQPIQSEIEIIEQPTNLKAQTISSLEALFFFINPLLKGKGIEPITNLEIKDLVNAIFDLFEGNIKKIVKSVDTNISFVKNLKKLLALGKAIWNIIGSRLERFKILYHQNKEQQELKRLEQIKKRKEQQND